MVKLQCNRAFGFKSVELGRRMVVGHNKKQTKNIAAIIARLGVGRYVVMICCWPNMTDILARWSITIFYKLTDTVNIKSKNITA